MGKFAAIIAALAFLSAFDAAVAQQNEPQNQTTVTYCPLYLVLQNRCPTPSTTTRTTKRPASNDSGESDVVMDECGSPILSFCPAMEMFLSGGRNCSQRQTVQVSLTTLGQLLVSPSGENAAATVGQSYIDALGDTLTSISKTIQATPTQATIGVTFIPVGQIIG